VRRSAARAELGLREDELVIGTVGNRNPAKAHDLLIETAARLLPQHPEAQVLILGGTSPGHPEYEAGLQASLARQRLGARVRFVDPADRVPELLPALDVFVLPSRSEGMPAVVLEAMACALPVIATDVGAVREEVLDGVTGLVVGSEDPTALAAALSSLAQDADARERMGRAGRERVIPLFSPERAVANRLRAWELALGRRRTS
jgi:glycosyltransferase involved in cell wall biosynthesis